MERYVGLKLESTGSREWAAAVVFERNRLLVQVQGNGRDLTTLGLASIIHSRQNDNKAGLMDAACDGRTDWRIDVWAGVQAAGWRSDGALMSILFSVCLDKFF